jgi:hypothetical protein
MIGVGGHRLIEIPPRQTKHDHHGIRIGHACATDADFGGLSQPQALDSVIRDWISLKG